MKFESVSIILPTLTETDSFIETVELILETNQSADIREFIAVVCEKTKKESLESIEKGRQKAEKAGVPLRIVWQERPFFGGAIIAGFQAAEGSHVCMVTPDMDTAPDILPEMIRMAKEHPDAVVSGSRWLKGGGFVNYNRVKLAWNWCSQQFLRLFYLAPMTDWTWGNHLAPSVLYRSINYRELKHPINIEKVVSPLRLGIRFYEVPGVCRMADKPTVNPFWANLLYLRPAFRWRFASKKKMLADGVTPEELLKKINN